MNIQSIEELFNHLLCASAPGEIQKILQAVGDYPSIEVSTPFGPLDLSWEYYGANSSNMSSVNLGSEPERSLTERVTNAIDAVFEREFHNRQDQEAPKSPMDAAELWFGRPPSGADSGIFTWTDYKDQALDKQVQVVLLDGDTDENPSIDVIDQGLGIAAAEFPNTILSLQQGNKIRKRYLAGAFGQGGASSLAFSDYTLIISRHMDSQDVLGFTLIKLLVLPEEYKENAYVYLTVRKEGASEIMCVHGSESLDLHPGIEKEKPLLDFEHGTLVRSYGYGIEKHNKALQAASGSLAHLLNTMMFDPLLPFTIVDLRSKYRQQQETIIGARNRLMAYTLTGTGDFSDRTEFKYYSPMEMVSPKSKAAPSVGVEYWVFFGYRMVNENLTLRRYSSDLFVNHERPVIGTINGQNQGEETITFVKNLNLGMLSRHLIIHIDISKAPKGIRSELFSSTRERFKKNLVYDELIKVISKRIDEDEVLFDLETELVDTMLFKGSGQETGEADEEVRSEIATLLQHSGYKVRVPGYLTYKDPTKPDNSGNGRKLEPVPTLHYPGASFLKIVQPEELLKIHLGDNKAVKIETDADEQFYKEGRIGISIEPGHLEIASISLLKGGRMNYRVRPMQNAAHGDTGEVSISLSLPSGQFLVDKIPFEILPQKPDTRPKIKAYIPSFRIIPVDPYVDQAIFRQIWPDATQEDVGKMAYKSLDVQSEIRVYYSKGFLPYINQLEIIKQNASVATLFEQYYKIWIGYHAILQHQAQKEPDYAEISDSESVIERLSERERAIVAEMQVKQAYRTAVMDLENRRNRDTLG